MRKTQDEKISDILDVLADIKDEEIFQENFNKIAVHPFFGLLLQRITRLEQQANEYAKHEHKTNGDIVIRTQ